MEWLWACSILLVILAVPVAMTVALVRLHRRVGELDRRLREQSERMDRLAVEGRVEERVEARDPADVEKVVAEAAPTLSREIASSEVEPPESVEIPPDIDPDADPDDDDSKSLWGGLEEAIWTRLPVWIGAAALALAAAYLVKIGVDSGWIGPGVRVGAGMAFGGALLVGGEVLRRSSSYVAQGLSAAGVAALYVSSYAAVELYQLVPPAAGFALMAATTAAAVALSLRQGYVVATVGLIGGFLTPSLLAGEERSAGTLFVYLLLLQIGLLVVVRKQRWASLGLITAVAGLLWVVAVLADTLDGTDALWTGLFLVGSTLTFLAARLLDPGRGEEPSGSRLASSLVGWAATGGGLLASGVLASRMEHGALEWTFVGLLALACLAAARLDETRDDRLHGLAWLASVLVAIFFAAWLADPDPADARRALLTLAGLGTLLTAGAWAAHLGSRRPGAWAALAAALPVVFLLLATEGAPRLGLDDFPGGGLALTLAFAVLASAVPVHRRREQAERGSAEHGDASRALAALAAGVAALVALAVPLELEREWLAVAWALQIPALLWLADRLGVGTLRAAAA